MAGPVVTRDLLARATLARQLLLERRRVPVKRAIARLAGVNAQDPRQPDVSLLARVEGFTPGSLVRLLRRREVVRATAFRGTLHLLTADDYVTWREALTPVVTRRAGRSRSDVVDLDETWLRRPLGPADAGAESIVMRYLTAFGPATVKDVQHWSGLTGLRAVIDKLAPRLRFLHDAVGREYVDVPRAPLPDPTTPAPPRLLPANDSLLSAHADRTRFLGGRRPHGRSFLVRARVAGTWSVEANRLVLRPFDTIPRYERAPLRAEAERVVAMLTDEPGSVEIGQP